MGVYLLYFEDKVCLLGFVYWVVVGCWDLIYGWVGLVVGCVISWSGSCMYWGWYCYLLVMLEWSVGND